MAGTQASADGRVRHLVAVASVLVAASTPFNLLLLLLCRGLTGDSTTREFSVGEILSGGVVNVGLFLALCGITMVACRRMSAFWRRFAVLAALVLHLALWLGGSLALVAVMVATDYAQ